MMSFSRQIINEVHLDLCGKSRRIKMELEGRIIRIELYIHKTLLKG